MSDLVEQQQDVDMDSKFLPEDATHKTNSEFTWEKPGRHQLRKRPKSASPGMEQVDAMCLLIKAAGRTWHHLVTP